MDRAVRNGLRASLGKLTVCLSGQQEERHVEAAHRVAGVEICCRTSGPERLTTPTTPGVERAATSEAVPPIEAPGEHDPARAAASELSRPPRPRSRRGPSGAEVEREGARSPASASRLCERKPLAEVLPRWCARTTTARARPRRRIPLERLPFAPQTRAISPSSDVAQPSRRSSDVRFLGRRGGRELPAAAFASRPPSPPHPESESRGCEEGGRHDPHHGLRRSPGTGVRRGVLVPCEGAAGASDRGLRGGHEAATART